ncbi:zinc ribbon domain-containing protein [Halobaculum magnesiiphilum]|uniref:Zinc ribbon domain-containing protein n=1 Tax=Halobaculum magnesiiphilum TaxID=1017351 RepID=A0A8T8WC19_9EURY|nr:zinc ribbon domain-containing protein [Halobaculum magnesiiphilum]QZP37303.1 zinc ribbon domain-containing protein [Halobaculum magnesiiphilum]
MNLPRLGGPTGRKRPWLAVLLALAVTGLGHAYLRRWLRGFAWLAVTFAAVLLFAPVDMFESVVVSDPQTYPMMPPEVTLVVIASVVDAYFVARRINSTSQSSKPDIENEYQSEENSLTCPNCGKDLDADLDFCPWCTARIDWGGPGTSEAAGGPDDGSNP